MRPHPLCHTPPLNSPTDQPLVLSHWLLRSQRFKNDVIPRKRPGDFVVSEDPANHVHQPSIAPASRAAPVWTKVHSTCPHLWHQRLHALASERRPQDE
eukprot:170615-Chlamydomonas_euryale.AAC.1